MVIMASLMTSRILTRECTRNILRSQICGNGSIPLKTLVTSPLIQKFTQKKDSSILQKAYLTQSSLSRTSTDVAKASGDHVLLWTAERALAVIQLSILPAAFIFPCSAMDCALSVALSLHSHWGIEALIHDYVRPALFGNVIPKLSIVAVYLLSILTLGGLLYFNYTDVGIVNAIRMFWKL